MNAIFNHGSDALREPIVITTQAGFSGIDRVQIMAEAASENLIRISSDSNSPLDYAERGVALVQAFSGRLTNDWEQLQYALRWRQITHGSSEGHFMLKRHDICRSIADVELIPEMCF